MEQRCRGAGGSEISMPSSMGHGISARELPSAVSEPFAPISSPAVPMSTTVSLQQPLPTLSSSAVTPRLGNGPGAAFPPDVPARAVPDPVVVTSSAARPAGATAGGGSANHHARLATTAAATAKSPPAAAAKYRECLRNHAASVGGLVVDGCGEFMPGGEEGVGGGGDPLKCAVCGCHRSFHRKEVEGEQQHRPAIAPTPYYYHPHHFSAVTSNGNGGRRGATATTPTSRIQIPPPPLLALPPPLPRQQPQPQPQPLLNPSPMTTFGGPRGGNESSGGGGGTTTESSSEEMEAHTPVVPPPFSHAAASTTSTHVQQQQAFPMVTPPPSSVLSRKRFRTKFTTEQKERMMGFSEALGWRMQRKDEGAVDRFCAEVGVPRKVFKVWMHNNKHISSSKKLQQLHEPDQQPQQTPSPP